MKLKICFLGLLCAFFCAEAQYRVLAQGLKIGDKVPGNIVMKLVNTHRANAGQAGEINLAGFKGKLLILDFWSTYCGACVDAMPRLDSLQRVYGDKIVILPVAFEKENKIQAFWKTNRVLNGLGHLSSVVEDKELQLLFPHRLLPHDVWIDPNGTVLGFTAAEEITKERILAVMSGQGLAVGMKQDVLDYDRDSPLLVNNNGGKDNNYRCRSLLTGYLPGLPAGLQVNVDTIKNQIRVKAVNVSARRLYGLVYKKLRFLPDDRISGNGRGLLIAPGIAVRDTGSLYCYDLTLPGRSVALARRSIREDLDRFFAVKTEWIESTEALEISPLDIEYNQQESFTL